MKNISILTAYFSHSGNTKRIAEQIHERAGGGIFGIVPVDPYPAEYNSVVEQARQELDRKAMPRLKETSAKMESFTVVFLGYPNWWGTFPRPVATFLSEHDPAGKTIAPFCTHEGSGMGRSVSDLRKTCPHSTVLEGLAIRGSDVSNANSAVAGWLREIGMDT
jgi:flavodoxin